MGKNKVSYGLVDELKHPAERLGNWTGLKYNAIGVLEKVTNVLGNVTNYDLCNCGAVNAVTDPLGKTVTLVSAGTIITTRWRE